MVTLTLATLENQLPLFIKSVIEHTIVDTVARVSPNQFVYKEAPTKPATQYPYIIVELDSINNEQFAYDGSLRLPRDISVSIRIICKGANALATRDTLADSIITALYSGASTDMSARSMNDNLLELRSVNSSPTSYFSKEGDVVKMKELSCKFRYRGA